MSEAGVRRDVVRQLTDSVMKGDKVALGTLSPELRGEILERIRDEFRARKQEEYDTWDNTERKFYREAMKTLTELGRENPSFVHVQFNFVTSTVLYGAPLRPYDEKINFKKSEAAGGTYEVEHNELEKLESGYRPYAKPQFDKRDFLVVQGRINELEEKRKAHMERMQHATRKVEQLTYAASPMSSYRDLKIQKRLEYRSESKIEYQIDYTGGWLFPYTLYLRQGAFRAHPRVFWTYRAAKVRGEYYIERQRIVKARLQGFREMQMTEQEIWNRDFNS